GLCFVSSEDRGQLAEALLGGRSGIGGYEFQRQWDIRDRTQQLVVGLPEEGQDTAAGFAFRPELGGSARGGIDQRRFANAVPLEIAIVIAVTAEEFIGAISRERNLEFASGLAGN